MEGSLERRERGGRERGDEREGEERERGDSLGPSCGGGVAWGSVTRWLSSVDASREWRCQILDGGDSCPPPRGREGDCWQARLTLDL